MIIFQLHNIIANRTFLNKIAQRRKVKNINQCSLYPQGFAYCWDLLLLLTVNISCRMLNNNIHPVPVEFILPRNFIGQWLFPWLNEDARHLYGVGAAILLTLSMCSSEASLPMSNKLMYIAGGNWEVYTPKSRILATRLVCHVTYRVSDAQFSSCNQSLNCTRPAVSWRAIY